MNAMLLLIPISLVLVAFSIWAFFWAVDHDQFESLDRASLEPLDRDFVDPLEPTNPAAAEAHPASIKKTQNNEHEHEHGHGHWHD